MILTNGIIDLSLNNINKDLLLKKQSNNSIYFKNKTKLKFDNIFNYEDIYKNIKSNNLNIIITNNIINNSIHSLFMKKNGFTFNIILSDNI